MEGIGKEEKLVLLLCWVVLWVSALVQLIRRRCCCWLYWRENRGSVLRECCGWARYVACGSVSRSTRLILLIACFAMMQALVQFSAGFCPRSWRCGEKSGVCVPVLDARKWELVLSSAFVTISAMSSAQFVEASGQLEEDFSGRVSARETLVKLATLISVVNVLVVISVPAHFLDKRDDGKKNVFFMAIHLLLALFGAVLGFILLWSFATIRRASADVSMHTLIVSRMMRRITIVCLILTVGLIVFGICELWYGIGPFESLEDDPVVEVKVLVNLTTQLVPSAVLLLHFSAVPVEVDAAAIARSRQAQLQEEGNFADLRRPLVRPEISME